MSFLVPLGLLVAALVVGPLVAHLLRRRKPEERPFPAARLVPTAPPVARRRASIEDRWLLLVRALAIVLLAFLAASPLARCTRLSLDRRAGASIALAIVLDDSMSMRAELPPGARRGGARTRFELAIVAARELAASLREGDSTAIVLAGSPARVALAPTLEAGVVRATIEALAQAGPSDRGTDLEGAIALGTAALAELPQPDRRVVLLSDLADGNPAGAPLAAPDGKPVRLEAPLDALRAPPEKGPVDCAVLAATPEGAGDAIRARVACALQGTPVGKRAIEIVLLDGTKVGATAFPAAPPQAPFDVVVSIDKSKAPSPAPANGKPTLLARIVGEADAIASDDVAPVLGASTAPAIAVVVGEGGALDEVVATGGAPILERALSALQTGVPVRPIPSTPDRDVDLAGFAGLAIDDPGGFGPEVRVALATWVERGGVLLVALGPRASSPSLGASFEKFLSRPVRWEKVNGKLGVDPKLAGPLGEGVEPAADLSAKGRAVLDREDVAAYVVRAAFEDGSPLLLSRAMGQGEVWIVTLPFAPDVSDLPLRPSFLALLDAFVSRARDRGAGARLTAGEAWSVGPEDDIEAVALDDKGNPVGSPLPVEKTEAGKRVRPARIGAYLVTTRAKASEPRREVRAVVPTPAEIELRPRALAESVASGSGSGLSRNTIDLGPTLALFLLAVAGLELAARALRLLAAPKEDAESSAEGAS